MVNNFVPFISYLWIIQNLLRSFKIYFIGDLNPILSLLMDYPKSLEEF